MRWNPYLNALCAAAYIWGVGFFFQWFSATQATIQDNIFDPILALSLLVFSVALMGFLFFYKPVTLLLDNKKEDAVAYFLKTLATFGAIALVVVLLLVVS